MGINVASDTKAGLRFADMIVDGHKTLESRNSDTLRPYVGKRVSIVRTGEGKAKAIGEVTIGEPQVVNQRQFRSMEDEHLVPKGSRFDINTPTKHLYPMHDPVRYEEERDVGHGIVSRKVIHKARGGAVEPTIDQMRQALAKGGSAKDPKSTVKAYKLFRVHKDHPGKLFPLFVDANTPVEMNKWVDAKEGEMKGNKVKSKIGDLAYRPGWHAGDLPIATHIGEKSDPSKTAPDRRPANHAWAEVEMPDDVDWQSEATKRGTNAQGKVVPVKAHITDQIPKGGHYRYKTNPNMTGNWLIGGSMKVNKVLSDAEVERINNKAGMSDLPRTEPFAKKTFGFAGGGMVNVCVAPDEFKAEEYVNYKSKGGDVKNTFDYENPSHVENVANIAAKHRDFNKIPDVAKHLAQFISQGSYKSIEDPRIQMAIKQAGYDGYHVNVKDNKQIIRKASGGGVNKPRTKIAVFGDSISSSIGYNPDGTADITHGNSLADYLGKNLKLSTSNNTRGGATSVDSINGVEKDPFEFNNFAKYITENNPETALLRYGAADAALLTDPATSLRNIERMVQISRENGTKPVLVGVTPFAKMGEINAGGITSTWITDERIAAANEINQGIQDLADKYGVQFIDVRKVPVPQGALLDGIHPNGEYGFALDQYISGQIEPFEDAKKAGLELPPKWHDYKQKDKIDWFNNNNVSSDMLLQADVSQDDIDWMSNNGYTVNARQQQPQRMMAQAQPQAQSQEMSGLATLGDEQGYAGYQTGDSGIPGDELRAKVLGTPYASQEEIEAFNRSLYVPNPNEYGRPQIATSVDPVPQTGGYDQLPPAPLATLAPPVTPPVTPAAPDYSRAYNSLGGAEAVNELRNTFTNMGMNEDAIGSVFSNYYSPDQTTAGNMMPATNPQNISTNSIMRDGGIVRKAEGGAVLPIEQIKAQMMNRFKGLGQLQSIGANEAPSMGIKAYVPTSGSPDANRMPVGGIDTAMGSLPVGGVDMSKQQPGQQLMPAPAGQQQGMNQVPQGDKMPTMDGTGMPPNPNANPNQMGSNILSMTPQGQAMAAMKPQGLAEGGSAKSTADMKAELAAKKNIADGTSTRIKIDAEGAGGVKGIVVPRHMWEGKTYKGEGGKKVDGMRDVNEARAKVYGGERRDPMTSGQMNSLHKKILAEHFQKPLHEQTADEEAALEKLREAKHIGKTANTLDKSEKLDTVNHEEDSAGRNYVGFASKGVAGHSLYTSGHGEDQKHHVINTCAGQTVGCGGGTDKNGIVDTSRGTCFAPNAESQYVNAAVRRASHEQAKHDPAMSKDWILAHTGSLRNAAENADKKNKVLLFRPNVVDETDVTSRHAIRHLNDQRKATGKPNIEANSYGKTNELHDPENGYHVTHSNVGPKVKKGASIEENISRDKARVRNTIMAADNKGDFKNEQGNKTPPKGSYMVTDVKRGSEMSKNMEKNITHAKYWSTGRTDSELTPEERKEGPEGHFDGKHKPTTEDQAHYGHKTVNDLRFDYQKQHVLHPRLVQVGHNEDGSKHMIPTDSRFKDEEFLPKNRFKTKNGKNAGHILMTTPTESTSSIGHQTSFTHHVNDSHIEHAKKNNGEYVIDKPEDQIKSAGKEYAAPQAIKFYADGGEVNGRHAGLSDDDFHAFPEQNYAAQRHMALRGHDREAVAKHNLSDNKRKVTINKDLDTMLLELTRNKKAK
jgi:hypothetical protein